MPINKLALTPDERARLQEQGLIHPEERPRVGRPLRASSFKDERPVCSQRGCFNYVANNGDKYCPTHTPAQTFTTQIPPK